MDLFGKSSGLMKGTTPPWLMTTCPRSLLNLDDRKEKTTLGSFVFITKGGVRVEEEGDSLFVVPDSQL